MISNGERSEGRSRRTSCATEGVEGGGFDENVADAAELAALAGESGVHRSLFSVASMGVIGVGFVGTIEYSILMPSLNQVGSYTNFAHILFALLKHTFIFLFLVLFVLFEMAKQYVRELGQTHLFYGVTMGIFSFARLICMPLLGIWSDRRPMLEPLVASIIVGIIGNAMYACAWGANNAWLIMFGRIIVGCGAANGALSMAYITRISKPENRTSAIALTNGINLVGIVVGPASNLLVMGIKGDLGGPLVFNEYTNPGWFMVILLSLLLCLILATFEEPPKAEYTEIAGEQADSEACNGSLAGASARSEASFSTLSIPPSPIVSGSPFFPTDTNNTSAADVSFSSRRTNGSVTRSPGLVSEAASAVDDLQEPILGTSAMHQLEDSIRNKSRMAAAYRTLIENNLWVHFVVSFCSNFVLCELEVALPAMTGTAFGWDTLENSFMYAFIGLFVALNLVAIMFLSKRVQDRHFILVGLCGQCLALVFAVLTLRDPHPSLAMFIVVVLTLIGACPMTGSPNMGLYTKRLQEDESAIQHLGLFIGLLQTINGAARTIAPVISGLALSASDKDNIYVYGSPLVVVVFSLFVFFCNYDNFRIKSLVN